MSYMRVTLSCRGSARRHRRASSTGRLSASTLGASFTQVVFSFQLTPALAAEGFVLALLVGLIGGLFPAVRAARMPIVAGLYG